jgi:Flp pilus assembly protein TadB
MTPRLAAWSERAYALLLRAYPPAYQRRFAAELTQVFRLLCRKRLEKAGAWGLPVFWLPILADWAWTATAQWIDQFFGQRRQMMNNGLDRQLGDLTWSLATGLRAGYSLRQVFAALAEEAPEPAAGACRRLLELIAQHGDIQAALAAWTQAMPSSALTRLVTVLLQQPEGGGNLPDQLDPLTDQFLTECGSDPVFYPAMRREAAQLGAKTPERAKE